MSKPVRITLFMLSIVVIGFVALLFGREFDTPMHRAMNAPEKAVMDALKRASGE